MSRSKVQKNHLDVPGKNHTDQRGIAAQPAEPRRIVALAQGTKPFNTRGSMFVRSGEMRKDILGVGLLVLGAGAALGAMQTLAANRALGNPIEGAFLAELVAMGLGGVAAFVVGVVLLSRSLRRSTALHLQPAATVPPPPTTTGGRTSRSAIAFLVLLGLLVCVYLVLVFVTSGVSGVLLQFVFFVPIIAVVLLLARWWSRLASPESQPPTSPR